MKNKDMTMHEKAAQNGFYNSPFAMAEIIPPVFPDNTLTAKDTGNGRSIQRAIEECASCGGGTVIIPAGQWFSRGPLHLKSNIRLVISDGAEVHFSDTFADYLPVVFTRWEGTECYNYSPLIYAIDCENIAIVGTGRFFGHGQAWWPWKQLQEEAATSLCHAEANGVPVSERIYGTEKAALRPSFLQTVHCRNVHLQGFSVIDGPQWTIHPVYCENILIQDITVKTSGPNTDGLNPDSCRNVVIENCHFETGDDCIAINSGMNEDGWRVDKPCENIIIRNCRMYDGHGAIVIGSGMSGGVRNVYATDNRATGGMWGIRLKSMRGRGGFVENIWIENMEINNTSRHAIQISMFYDTTTVVPANTTPADFSKIYLKNITGNHNSDKLEIIGLPEHPIQDITLDNVCFTPASSLEIRAVDEIRITQGRKHHA